MSPQALAANGQPRGRPRSAASRKAILHAASDLLLEHGLSSISMDAVAERAGTSKATIYRWWTSKELLAVEALFSDWKPPARAIADTGALEADLLALMRPWARRLKSKPYGRVIAALVLKAHDDPQFALIYQAQFIKPRRDPARLIFERAVARGELSVRTDIETAIDLLYGPFYHRLLHAHAPLTDRFTDASVGFVVRALELP
jgi:AcrR family transcriptional regulator